MCVVVTMSEAKQLVDNLNSIDEASGFWFGDKPDRAGIVIHNILPLEMVPKWSVGILRCVIYSRPLRQACGRNFYWLEELVYVGGHPKTWRKAGKCARKIRKAIVALSKESDEIVKSVFVVGELVAKIVLASANRELSLLPKLSAEIASALKSIEQKWDDESFSRDVWRALSCHSHGAHVEQARGHWLRGTPYEAGRLLFENLPLEISPAWGLEILKMVVRNCELSFCYLEPLEKLVENPKKWKQAHGLFDLIRRSLLKLDKLGESSETASVPAELDCLIRIHVLGELVAKITFNATNPRDPYDYDSGWGIVTLGLGTQT